MNNEQKRIETKIGVADDRTTSRPYYLIETNFPKIRFNSLTVDYYNNTIALTRQVTNDKLPRKLKKEIFGTRSIRRSTDIRTSFNEDGEHAMYNLIQTAKKYSNFVLPVLTSKDKGLI